MSSQFEDLKRLAEMRDSGDIDQAEYEKLKAQLMNEVEDVSDRAAAPPPPREDSAESRTRWYLIGGGVLMGVGSFLPWAQAGIFSVPGTDGDGILTLIAGVIVALVGVANRKSIVASLIAALAGGFSVWVVVNIFGNFDVGDYGSIGSGLYLTLLASFVAAIAGVQLAVESRRSGASGNESSGPESDWLEDLH